MDNFRSKEVTQWSQRNPILPNPKKPIETSRISITESVNSRDLNWREDDKRTEFGHQEVVTAGTTPGAEEEVPRHDGNTEGEGAGTGRSMQAEVEEGRGRRATDATVTDIDNAQVAHEYLVRIQKKGDCSSSTQNSEGNCSRNYSNSMEYASENEQNDERNLTDQEMCRMNDEPNQTIMMEPEDDDGMMQTFKDCRDDAMMGTFKDCRDDAMMGTFKDCRDDAMFRSRSHGDEGVEQVTAETTMAESSLYDGNYLVDDLRMDRQKCESRHIDAETQTPSTDSHSADAGARGKAGVEQKWLEIGEGLVFWDSLKSNIKSMLLLSMDSDAKPKEGSAETVEVKSREAPAVTTEAKKDSEENGRRRETFPLSPDCYVKCLQFLTADKILECELINKLTSNIINNRINVFVNVTRLNLDERWAALPIYKRQYYLHQMKNLKYIKSSEKIYAGTGIYIHEVAAIIFQNVKTLRTLELLSPEFYMDDNTPRHEPFAFLPLCFEKLEKLTIIGCQSLEWLHIFRNCSFPLLKKLEVCYYPLRHDHWYWNFIFDFTILGLQGFFNILHSMENLQKIVIGFDVLFDNPEGDTLNPPGSLRSSIDPYSIIDSNSRQYTNGIVPQAHGFPSRKFKSYRGRLCEEDFSDIFSLVYFISGKFGKLNKIMIRYRNSQEANEEGAPGEESINEFFSGAANTATVCYNFVRNWFRSSDEA